MGSSRSSSKLRLEEKLTAVTADFQTAGRGTGGRSWHATKVRPTDIPWCLRLTASATVCPLLDLSVGTAPTSQRLLGRPKV